MYSLFPASQFSKMRGPDFHAGKIDNEMFISYGFSMLCTIATYSTYIHRHRKPYQGLAGREEKSRLTLMAEGMVTPSAGWWVIPGYAGWSPIPTILQQDGRLVKSGGETRTRPPKHTIRCDAWYGIKSRICLIKSPALRYAF